MAFRLITRRFFESFNTSDRDMMKIAFPEAEDTHRHQYFAARAQGECVRGAAARRHIGGHIMMLLEES